MPYMHIENSSRRAEMFDEPALICLEKIHGTSAHIGIDAERSEIAYFSGGVKREPFVALFDEGLLIQRSKTMLMPDDDGNLKAMSPITIYGEAYGGACQRMSDVYGPNLKFVAFDVKFGDEWLNVYDAKAVVEHFGIEFVSIYKIEQPDLLAKADAERDRDSAQAIRNGMGPGKKGEGIVLRPLVERLDRRGNRVICKHKRLEFRETKTPRPVSADKVAALQAASAIADEWVTEMRIRHVVDHVVAKHYNDGDSEAGWSLSMADTSEVVRALLRDVRREAGGEVAWTHDAERSVCTAGANLFKKILAMTPESAVGAPVTSCHDAGCEEAVNL